MPFLKFADNAAMYDSTPLDNMFIIENLPSAPEAFLKVYIYARMLCMHPEMGGIDELSRALKLDSEMIENAFAYWERAGFMRRVADNPPEYVFMPTRGSTVTEMDRDYYKYRDFNGDLQSLFPAGKLIHPAQYGMANDWLNVYGFEQGAVIALVKHVISNSKSKNPDPARIFKSVDKKVQELAKLDITDEAGVERYIGRDDKVSDCAREVLSSMGMRRAPTDAELRLASKWIYDWSLSPEDIQNGLRRTVNAHSPSFGYLDTVLDGMRDASADNSFNNMRAIFRVMGVNGTPTADQRKWYDEQIKAGFEHETIELAASSISGRKNANFEQLSNMIIRWKDRGLLKHEEANAFVKYRLELQADFSRLLNDAGIERTPNGDETVGYEMWINSMSRELISFAAEKAKGTSQPISYMSKLLNNWLNMGITEVEAAKAQLNAKGQSQPRTAPQPKANPALNYQQRDYNDDDFDGDAFMEEARRLMEQQDTGTGVN